MFIATKNKLIYLTLVLVVCGAVVEAVSKKGTTFGSDDKGDLAICSDIRDLKVTWYYNWDLKPNCNANANIIPGVQFYPTIWGAANLNSNTAKNIAKADVLFTFNEVNFGTQANLKPTDVASKWPDIEKLGFKYIVGPSVADCPDNSDPNGQYCNYGGVKWYKDFFAACPNCKVDYVNIHIYYCDADDVMNKITNLNKATGKKVWLTEFNCDGAKDDTAVLNYAKKLLPLLEASDIVAGYAWFLPYYTEGNINSLYLNQNGKGDLSPIGKYYASVVSNPTTSTSSTTSTGGSTSAGSSTSSSSSTSTPSPSSTGGSTTSDQNTNGATKSTISIILLSFILIISLLF
ncbi:hypothetical protein CYY_000602 [Polysphondylium violaceum]|uniref:Asl1-like glycosyl hydrolase catalytic domain-containing protein n=1 Tax=Polysphondylium violaceum TaxID=133409 RepID=A0A8J4QAR6_9MYCE|nr:hypothetical protein CYY_000602 [Polysphondylium violaceum]